MKTGCARISLRAILGGADGGADRLLVIGESAGSQRLVKESAVVRHAGNQLVIMIDLQLPEQRVEGAGAYLQAILIAHSNPNGGAAADGLGVLPHQLERTVGLHV